LRGYFMDRTRLGSPLAALLLVVPVTGKRCAWRNQDARQQGERTGETARESRGGDPLAIFDQRSPGNRLAVCRQAHTAMHHVEAGRSPWFNPKKRGCRRRSAGRGLRIQLASARGRSIGNARGQDEMLIGSLKLLAGRKAGRRAHRQRRGGCGSTAGPTPPGAQTSTEAGAPRRPAWQLLQASAASSTVTM